MNLSLGDLPAQAKRLHIAHALLDGRLDSSGIMGLPASERASIIALVEQIATRAEGVRRAALRRKARRKAARVARRRNRRG